MSAITKYIQGPVHAFYAPYGTIPAPAFADIATLLAGTFAGYTPFGETSGGLNVTVTPTDLELKTDQRAFAFEQIITDAVATVKFSLVEVTTEALTNMLFGTSTAVTTVSTSVVGGLGPRAKHALAIVTPAPGGTGNLLWLASRAAYKTAESLDLTRDKETILTVEFNLLSDDSGSILEVIGTTVV